MTTVTRLPADRQLVGAVASQVVMLAVLSGTVGLGVVGWLAGVAFAVGLSAVLAVAVRRSCVDTLGPAGVVTLARAVLVGAVTALVAHEPAGDLAHTSVLVGLASVAFVLDAVDGRVARRTGTASALGARFDMELDAFLILVLSAQVAARLGWWVLAIGGMRYAFVAVSRAVPWMRAPVPARNSARVIAAVQGIVLVAAASDLLPRAISAALVAVALLLLAWSFGQDVRWLRRTPEGADSGLTAVLAGLLVLAALLAPHQLREFTLAAFVRIPVEALVGVVVLLVLPARARRIAAVLGGVALGLLTVTALVNAGFLVALDRQFHPVIDWVLLDDAAGFVRTALGETGAVVVVILAVALALAVPVLMALAVLRLSRLVIAHRTVAIRAVAVLAPVWLACALLQVQIAARVPIASMGTSAHARDLAVQVHTDLRDRTTFAASIKADPFAGVPGDRELARLRGKDVVLAFVESYGRSAIEDPAYAPQVNAVLDEGTRRLGEAGFAARSAFLTSPTTGGGSWLAHSTLLSGLWLDNQERYGSVVASDRLTLNRVFQRAGWKTVGVLPGLTQQWPEERFYDYDKLYGAPDLGYRGPWFSFAPMPDQFALAAFQQSERARPDRPPLMAQIVLISSHAPWSPRPRLLGWEELGDGSIYHSMAGPGFPPNAILTRDPAQVRADYRQSIEYSLQSLISYLETYGDDRMVLVFLGDHQPSPIVVGPDASRDVPITIVAKDPAVLDSIAGWGWQDGLRPAPDAPVWRMDAFRDRFLTAFGDAYGS